MYNNKRASLSDLHALLLSISSKLLWWVSVILIILSLMLTFWSCEMEFGSDIHVPHRTDYRNQKWNDKITEMLALLLQSSYRSTFTLKWITNLSARRTRRPSLWHPLVANFFVLLNNPFKGLINCINRLIEFKTEGGGCRVPAQTRRPGAMGEPRPVPAGSQRLKHVLAYGEEMQRCKGSPESCRKIAPTSPATNACSAVMVVLSPRNWSRGPEGELESPTETGAAFYFQRNRS